ncbi:adenylyl-sulfate kinase [Pedobacter nototheniae]|uniref:adenylyl-sulfate kinase n=1 Tax=Pedobacter nototheniae TaxID=2488994 RepID=UPI00292EFD3D|nr:adenylyl-sulfate kinase [Pedobacter nototheniae]
MAVILQFTGLSGAGKSTLAMQVLLELSNLGYRVKIIDGDVYRQTLCKDLGFSKADRIENICRLGNLANELSPQFDVIIIAAINPYEEARTQLKQRYNAALIFVHCELSVLRIRDTKGLYKRADLPNGNEQKIYSLTGVNDIFERPLNADLTLDTTQSFISESVDILIGYVLIRINKN